MPHPRQGVGGDNGDSEGSADRGGLAVELRGGGVSDSSLTPGLVQRIGAVSLGLQDARRPSHHKLVDRQNLHDVQRTLRPFCVCF